MRKIGFLAALIAFAFTCQGQGIFEFDTTDWNFGEVKEGVLAEHIFTYKNMGDKPLVISNIRASCGCTTPEWTREAVLPNEEGKIKVVYNSKNRPGSFYKTITITSNAKTPSYQLKIRGKVIREKKDGEESSSALPRPQAEIVLTKKEANLGTVQIGEIILQTFSYKNTGKADLTISGVSSKCRCARLTKKPIPLKPGESGTLEISFSPTKESEQAEQLILLTNASNRAGAILTLQATVVESLAPKSVVQEGKIGF